MNINVSESGKIKVVAVEGRLDTTNYNELEAVVTELISEGVKDVVFDLSELEYISSSGLRVMLLTLKKTSAAGGKLILCNMKEGIREIFEISGFTTIFTILPNMNDALNQF
jgi:anti-anti-sigma factor